MSQTEATTSTKRPVRIQLAMEDGPLPRVIKQVLPIAGNKDSHIYVESTGEADLVIFTDIRAIEEGYDTKKQYAYIDTASKREEPNLPEGCQVISGSTLLVSLINTITATRDSLGLIDEDVPTCKTDIVLLAGALSILVIEDTPKHIDSARSGLADHKLTFATGYQAAMSILESEKFDVVLTDLKLPMSSRTLSDQAFKIGELVPYGLLLMIEAAKQGTEFVGVVTDLGHHDDPFSAAFDHFGYMIDMWDSKVLMMHAQITDGAKDWKYALYQLVSNNGS
ncbi:hypothetical protein COB55_02430 [Candidatus Wolfebacteria bacterium]|nr:MAG: hypothetical protein COB55_02430 [Candidatus Wolfebacteria bacterium]